MSHKNSGAHVTRIAGNGLLTIAVVLALAPIIYLVSLSLKRGSDIFNGSWLPSEIYWGNWPEAMDSLSRNLFHYVGNSWIVALGAAVISLLIATPTAYFTARHQSSGPKLLTLLLASYCVPPVVALIPMFLLWKQVGLINTVVGLTLITGLLNVPIAVWMLDGFIHKVPWEIEEAAWIDGASKIRAFLTVVVPLIKSGLVAAFLISLFLAFAEFLFAVTFSQTDASQTLSVALSIFQSSGKEISYGKLAVAALIGVAPMYVLALAAQKQLVEGATAGAVK